jgi:hypothetical protein
MAYGSRSNLSHVAAQQLAGSFGYKLLTIRPPRGHRPSDDEQKMDRGCTLHGRWMVRVRDLSCDLSAEEFSVKHPCAEVLHSTRTFGSSRDRHSSQSTSGS